MKPRPPGDRPALVALYLGATIPVLYYGIQVLCASYDPGYSFVRQTASELGSGRAARAGLFNAGLATQGVVTLVAALGFLWAMRRTGVGRVLAGLVFAALAVNGVQMLWAAHFSLPDPRHAGQPAFVVAATLLPILLTAALWRGSGAPLRVYLVATLVLSAAMVPVTSGAAGIDKTHVHGLIQRIYTLTVFPPVGVAAVALARRLRRLRGPAA